MMQFIAVHLAAAPYKPIYVPLLLPLPPLPRTPPLSLDREGLGGCLRSPAQNSCLKSGCIVSSVNGVDIIHVAKQNGSPKNKLPATPGNRSRSGLGN